MSTVEPAGQQLHKLYSEHHGWLYAWLGKKIGCALDAADLAQDTFLRVLSREDVGSIREPRSFLSTVAHGLMVNLLRRRDLERAYLQQLSTLPEAEAPSVEIQAIQFETLVMVDTLLDGLPVKVRRAFLWSQLEGLPHAEIAERLGVSTSSVRQYLVKAVRHCLTVQ